MLIRPHDDRTQDEPRWRAFVEGQGFGHLVAAGRDRDIPAVVPTQFVLEDDRVVLHLARPNPVFGYLDENSRCLLSIAGDWAYIPGSWKPVDGEDPRRGIPTTYYAAVQLICTATVSEDEESIAAVLRSQLDDLEPEGDHIDPLDHGATLRGIRGIVLTIDDVRAKFKFGGNVDEAHRRHVAARLTQRDEPGDRAARRQIEF